MAKLGNTVRILFVDGQARTFTHVLVDQDTAGWLFLTRSQDHPILARVPAPIAAYRLQTLKGWEYVEAGPPADTSRRRGGGDSAAHDANGDPGGHGEGNGK